MRTKHIFKVLALVLCIGAFALPTTAFAAGGKDTVPPSTARKGITLNMLGLSTQVTAVWSYISDGPYKTYEWNSTKIEFKHRTNKEITGLSYMTALVIQALKTLGKANVTQEVVETLSSKLSDTDKAALLKEGSESTDWVYDTIRQICGGEKA